MVVPVLMTSCYVSEKPNNGPLTAQTITTLTARIKVVARPAASHVIGEIAKKTSKFATFPRCGFCRS